MISPSANSPARPAVFSDAAEYYAKPHVGHKNRGYSINHNAAIRPFAPINETPVTTPTKGTIKFEVPRRRRWSHDEHSMPGQRFDVDVDATMKLILAQEDTDGDFQISATDSGPKLIALGTSASNGYKRSEVRGTYMLSNLLQELAIAQEYGHKRIILDEARLSENPVSRLSRMIKGSFWNGLTRRMDADGIEAIRRDPKARSGILRIYCPQGAPDIYQYYVDLVQLKPELNIEAILLPAVPDDPEYVKSLNTKPGILALDMRKVNGKLEAIPFVVPGARFNELYAWDSYFIVLGLVNDGKIDLARGMIDHFAFEITHYGKVPNGSRTYYLCRSQPPFLTSMALHVYAQLDREKDEAENIPWLRKIFQAAIKEYHSLWMAEPRLDTKTGLSRYRPSGQGIPPETEASHFTHILKPFAEAHGLSILEFTQKYNDLELECPELDEYFLHDRAVRESGHDTTYRFEKKCAHLATVDLNSLLYKYEVDIAETIRDIFSDELVLDQEFKLTSFGTKAHALSTDAQTSEEWFERATARQKRMNEYLWNEQQSMFQDYDTIKERAALYDSVTTFWPMWAGLASQEQADAMMEHSLKKFEVAGGLVSGTEESRGQISLARPNRQWDWPYGWAPHQMLAWVGMDRYGYTADAQRLAYRWIYMMTTAFVNFNGVVPEKFDLVKLSHLVDAEYGNQGLDFRCVPKEGFGWTSASYTVGLTFLTEHMRRAVALLTPPHTFFHLKEQ